MINTYHDGKYLQLLKSWKKYYQIIFYAFIGLSIFGTYGFTLAAIYNKYPIENAVAETVWGVTLYTLTTSITHFIINKFS